MSTNKSMFDGWTPLHVATGVLARGMGLSYTQFFVASVIFEVVEHLMESPGGSRFLGTKRPETPINVAGDLLAGSVGYLALQALRK